MVSASIGITTYPSDSDHLQSLVKQADEAMYVAKTKGAKPVRVFLRYLVAMAMNSMEYITWSTGDRQLNVEAFHEINE